MNIYEYQNDLQVRAWIQKILSAPELQNYPQLNIYSNLVALIDERFKKLLLPNVTIPQLADWWKSGVIRYAGKELAQDLQERYGIEIEVKS